MNLTYHQIKLKGILFNLKRHNRIQHVASVSHNEAKLQ